MLIGRRVRQQHLGDAIELRSRVGHTLRAGASNQHLHVAAHLPGSRERLVGRVFQGLVVVLGEQQGCHYRTPASFLSFSTSSATLLTFAPALRPDGSVVFKTSSRGATSTP